ncbi:uncharacterized protein EV422DRAFT_352322 [Fimicolochytrium jonesii]|uniref:uncharacterized protein n=1 Tax=Fimicolochytrium jonesii TaxID=1396493 RepID=UPI0022FDFFE4|nr:uncharacterized protein EV422DRAFT_352322 [Fimicolochytrium jonesii]KAI8823366.1 hypothetical protein EV422DRAFT_352322 [Fimicolochytrium jonesii]
MQDEGVPDEWIEALVCTGLRPGWDAVEAVEVGLEMGVPVEFVGMGVAEEVQRVQVYLAQRGVEAAVEEEMGNVVGKSHIHAELRKLFEGVGVAAADIGKIDTGSPLADSRLQNLVLDPANLARYNAIVSQHLKAGARNGGQTASRDRYLESEARNYVRCERIAESLQDVCEEFENGGLADGAVHPGEDRVVLAVIDRNCVDGVRKMVAALSS